MLAGTGSAELGGASPLGSGGSGLCSSVRKDRVRFFLTTFCCAVTAVEAERRCLVQFSLPQYTEGWPLLPGLAVQVRVSRLLPPLLYQGAAPLKAIETIWQQTQDQAQKATLHQTLLISSADGLVQGRAGVNANDHLHVCKNHLHGATLLLKPCQVGSSNAERRAEVCRCRTGPTLITSPLAFQMLKKAAFQSDKRNCTRHVEKYLFLFWKAVLTVNTGSRWFWFFFSL